MRKEETIERYGEEAYERQLEQQRAYGREYREAHREQEQARVKEWREENPEQVLAHQQERNRKGGKRYDKKLEYEHTGLQGDRNKIRSKHNKKYRKYKNIIAPNSQLHHEWIPDTSEYRGVALVEANQHRHGVVDVIEILDGKITLLTEEQVKAGGKDFEN